MIDALSNATALAAQVMLAWLGTPFALHGEHLRHASGFVAQVHHDCTALWPVATLLAALGAAWLVLSRRGRRAGAASLSVPPMRLFARGLFCLAAMVLANQLRLVAVLWTGASAPAWFGLTHEVLGPLFLVSAGAALVAWALRAPRAARASPGSRGSRPVLAAAAGMVVVPAAALVSAEPATMTAQAPAGSAAPAPNAQVAPIMSGDLIVKFRDATEPGQQLADVLAGRRTVAATAPLAARLARELGVPLVLAQVTSGREALLALDREALGRQLLARAGREASVQRAVMTVPPPSAGLAAGLPAAELVLRLETRPGTSAATREALAARLAVAGLAHPHVQADGGEANLRLRYDLDALTLALIARMQQRPDVEYAQANRLLRPQSPPSAGASR